jgi:hypothetical protein
VKQRRTQEEFGLSLLFSVAGKCENCGANFKFFDVPSEDEFLSKLLPLVESFLDIDDLLGVREVYSRSCSGEIQEFTKKIVLELVWVCPDVLSLDDPEIEDIEAAFVTTYNAATRFSEP